MGAPITGIPMIDAALRMLPRPAQLALEALAWLFRTLNRLTRRRAA